MKPSQYFFVDEVVIEKGTLGEAVVLDAAYVENTSLRYPSGMTIIYTGWIYRNTDNRWYLQQQLMKKHTPSTDSLFLKEFKAIITED